MDNTVVVGTANQLCVVDSSVSSVSVAGVDLPVADDMKVLGVVLDRRLTFHRRLHSCSVVQLPCAGHPSHQTSPNDGVSTDVSM